jgi:uncharacterized membrane protein YGL010W
MAADPAAPPPGSDATPLASAWTPRQRRIERLFAEYSDSHTHSLNLLIHWLAVPVIYWCVLALLSTLPFPSAWRLVPGLDWGTIAAVGVSLYMLTLSASLAAGMGILSSLCLAIAAAYSRWGDVPLWQFALFIFVFAWLLQFIGHKIEGRRPAFLRDVQFLLVGPAWLLSKVYRLFGIGY